MICGYKKNDGTLEGLFAKISENGSKWITGRGRLSSNVEPYAETSDTKVVGFRITRVEKSNPKSYFCKLIYINKSGLLRVLTATVFLVVLGK